MKGKGKTKSTSGKPVKGREYTDFLGRTLKVTEVVKDDPNGRDVRGLITYNPNGRTGAERTDPYSCRLAIFGHIWIKKARPATVAEMQTNERENEKKSTKKKAKSA